MKFKTKITGDRRRKLKAMGRHAARNGWERNSMCDGTRDAEAWYAGFDESPSTLIHCTEEGCGRMFSKGKTCPSCGSANVRPNVGDGTAIMMTVNTAK